MIACFALRYAAHFPALNIPTPAMCSRKATAVDFVEAFHFAAFNSRHKIRLWPSREHLGVLSVRHKVSSAVQSLSAAGDELRLEINAFHGGTVAQSLMVVECA
jgi:hypothetical protein